MARKVRLVRMKQRIIVGEFTRRLPISDCRQKTAGKKMDTVSRIRRCLFWIILADIRN